MKRRRGQEGVSLFEVLTAVSLFALVASAIGALSSQSMVHTAENRQATSAAFIVQEEMERMRGLEYVDVVNSSSSAVMAGQTFSVVDQVLDNTPAAGMKQITVTVSWTGIGGVSKSYAVQTIYTDITG